ncbi:hypothetical protein F862_gp057 [Vibrio phage vB_VpaS_MAR10]|uniref:Helix-turn-helix domain-containing protein n=1 Tax=Vibrio phage vB_VpaS_MAR10 TaxID=1229755 RepID=K7R2H5_9CAUD|nr:hypothetical protein F862_gp057 [Vibrio phage vB_VpaS_MAR10]AFV81289.1 hypothetical protein MAR10_056 [Vibrio phage vB_VpaS_MAR10]
MSEDKVVRLSTALDPDTVPHALCKIQFAQVPVDVIEDLSNMGVSGRAALTVFAWLQAKPEDWQIVNEVIMSQLGFSSGGLAAALKVLKEVGLLVKEPIRCTKCGKVAFHRSILSPHPAFSIDFLKVKYAMVLGKCCSPTGDTVVRKAGRPSIHNLDTGPNVQNLNTHRVDSPHSGQIDTTYKDNNLHGLSTNKESSNEDSIPSKRVRRPRRKQEGFNVSKPKERKPRTKSVELTKHVFTLENVGGEEHTLTKANFELLYDFVERQKIALTRGELDAWLEINNASLGLKIKTKRSVVATIKNWLARYSEADRWKIDKHLGKNTGRVGSRRPQRLNGNLSDRHRESEIRVPAHLQKLMDKES